MVQPSLMVPGLIAMLVVFVLSVVMTVIVSGVMAIMIYILNDVPIVACAANLHPIGMSSAIAVTHMTLSCRLSGKSQQQGRSSQEGN